MKYNKRLFTGYDKKLKSRADELRKNMTQQEWNLWYFYLRNHRLKWYRQRIIDRFIVDFYCHAAKLVIEIDGKQHYTDQGIVYGTERTQVLQGYGLKVLRYTNQQLECNFQEVCWDIEKNLQQ
jgi:very-short-patch-repair endonuclease